MFDVDQFIADCREAVIKDPTHKSVHEIVAEAVADHASVLAALGEPKRDRGCRRQVTIDRRLRSAGQGHHPLGVEPDTEIERRAACLWRRFLPRPSQRMVPGGVDGARDGRASFGPWI